MATGNPNNVPPGSFPIQGDTPNGSSIQSNQADESIEIASNLDSVRTDSMTIDSARHFNTHVSPFAGLDSTMKNPFPVNEFHNLQLTSNFIDPIDCTRFSRERLEENSGSVMHHQGLVRGNNSIVNPPNNQNFISNNRDYQPGKLNCSVSHPTSDNRLLGISDSNKSMPEFIAPIRENAYGSEWVTPLLNSLVQRADLSLLSPSNDINSDFVSIQSNNQRYMMEGYRYSSSLSQNLPSQQARQECITMPNNRGPVIGESMHVRSLGPDAFMGVQNYPTTALRPSSISRSHLLDSGQVRVPCLPAKYDHIPSNAARQSSEQLQRCLNLIPKLPNPSPISPFTGVHSSSSQVHIGNSRRPQHSLPLQHFNNLTRPALSPGQQQLLQLQEMVSNHRLPVYPETFGGSVPSNLPTSTFNTAPGPSIPPAKGTEFSQASSSRVGSSHKRGAIQPLHATAPVQRRKTIPLSYTPSIVPNIHQNALSVQTASTFFVNQQGPVISSAHGTDVGQASNARFGSSCNTETVGPVTIRPQQLIPPVQTRIPRPSTRPYFPTAYRNAPSFRTPPTFHMNPQGRVIPPINAGQGSITNRPPRAPPRVQHRKAPPFPSIKSSVPTAVQNSVETAPVVHIKRQGSEKTPLLKIKEVGVKCEICKQDVSYKPDGPVVLTIVPPSLPDVAVLPCGHVFHDYCLHRITPKDEAKNPPCIPCALGE